MRQFDVCRLRDGRDNLVVILQNDIADELDTRVVAPLSDRPYRRLIHGVRVPVDFAERPHVVQVDRPAAIPTRSIGSVIGSVAGAERHIKNALDLVFFEESDPPMADVINLRRARKAKERAEREQEAAGRRRAFGRSKAEKEKEAAERERARRTIDAHKRDDR